MGFNIHQSTRSAKTNEHEAVPVCGKGMDAGGNDAPGVTLRHSQRSAREVPVEIEADRE